MTVKCSECGFPIKTLAGEKERTVCFTCEHQIPMPMLPMKLADAKPLTIIKDSEIEESGVAEVVDGIRHSHICDTCHQSWEHVDSECAEVVGAGTRLDCPMCGEDGV